MCPGSEFVHTIFVCKLFSLGNIHKRRLPNFPNLWRGTYPCRLTSPIAYLAPRGDVLSCENPLPPRNDPCSTSNCFIFRVGIEKYDINDTNIQNHNCFVERTFNFCSLYQFIYCLFFLAQLFFRRTDQIEKELMRNKISFLLVVITFLHMQNWRL